MFYLGVGGWRCCCRPELRGCRPQVLCWIGRTLGFRLPICGRLWRGLGPWRQYRPLVRYPGGLKSFVDEDAANVVGGFSNDWREVVVGVEEEGRDFFGQRHGLHGSEGA